jgi:prepilin peptidase dependent protein A/type IV fimbrial biogenesis protein FimT
MQSHSGLTLLELLVTISIIMLLVTLGSPAITSMQKNLQLRGAVETSYFALQQARSSAISQNRDVTVAFKSGESWCAALSDIGECDCGIAQQCKLNGVEHKVSYVDYKFVELNTVSFGQDNQTIFDGNRGLAIGHAGSLIFSDGNRQLKLILSNMGRVRICAIDEPLGGYSTC